MPNLSSGEICGWHYATGQPILLCWHNGLISRIESADSPPPRNVWIAPGLFDLQVNGYGGVDFQQDNLKAGDLLSAVRQLRAAGCTGFLLALITDEWPKLTARLRHLRSVRAQSLE